MLSSKYWLKHGILTALTKKFRGIAGNIIRAIKMCAMRSNFVAKFHFVKISVPLLGQKRWRIFPLLWYFCNTVCVYFRGLTHWVVGLGVKSCNLCRNLGQSLEFASSNPRLCPSALSSRGAPSTQGEIPVAVQWYICRMTSETPRGFCTGAKGPLPPNYHLI